MIQGLCLGGEYGGAITYVAEHVSDERRGYYTGWLQTSPTLGIVVSLAVIIATRSYLGNQVFDAWAWRVPFLVSFLLVAIAIYIRLQLQETPIFEEIKAKGQMTKNPWKTEKSGGGCSLGANLSPPCNLRICRVILTKCRESQSISQLKVIVP